MKIIYEVVAGLDVHKKTVVATRRQVNTEVQMEWETKTFGTTTPELLKLHDWLGEWQCQQVAMESTGDYWKPVYNILEDSFRVVVVNSRHVKHVPGRKTDVKDAEWLAELMMYGLLKASFVPPKPQRALRELTRYRVRLVQERTRVVNRVQKLLEGANIKLSSVATDIMGVSARAMLEEIAEGQEDASQLAQLARGRLRNKIVELEKALTGLVDDHHRFLLAKQLEHIDFLDEQIIAIEAEIARQVEGMPPRQESPQLDGDDETGEDDSIQPEQETPLTWDQAVALLDTIPGVDKRTACAILAEIGIDMSQFPTDKHLAAWAGLAPGNYQSGGRRYSGRTTKGNPIVASTMVQAAWSAIRTKKDIFLKSRYHRLAARRGKKRAIVAVAHSMLVSIWHMLAHRQPYQELGGDFFDQRRKEAKINYLTRQLEKLTGGQVRLELQVAAT